MIYSVDINDEYRKSRSKLLKYSLLFSFILTATLAADILLVVLSKENYVANLIISIVITSLFSWFAIYFFTNIYNDINARYRYFKGYESGVKAIEEVQVIKKDDELTYVNGLYVYPLHIRYFDGLNVINKVIYILDDSDIYEPEEKLTITTYQRILIHAESHS